MLKEIYFVITRDKEKELFEYISNLTFCRIINPTENAINVTEHIDSQLYLIVNDEFEEMCTGFDSVNGVLNIPMDHSLSYLSYERFDFDEQKSKNRLFLVSYMKRNKQIKVAFKSVKKWIVMNSTTRTKFGGIIVYVVE